MTIGPPPLCMFCKHLCGAEKGKPMRCAAFPAGVPVEIIFSVHDHREEYPGDHDVRFEARDEAAGVAAARLAVLYWGEPARGEGEQMSE